MTFKLDISGHIQQQLISSVLYSKLNSLLIDKDKANLFEYIKSIKVTNSKVIIKTQKPIVNAELKLLEDNISDIFYSTLISFGFKYKEFKISFV